MTYKKRQVGRELRVIQTVPTLTSGRIFVLSALDTKEMAALLVSNNKRSCWNNNNNVIRHQVRYD